MNCRNSCLGCKKAIVINRKKILVFSALQVVCYRATSHTFKPKLEKIKKIPIFQEMELSNPKNKQFLIFPEMELSSLIFFFYFRKELSDLEK